MRKGVRVEGKEKIFAFSFCPLLLLPSAAIWAGPPAHTLYISMCLPFTWAPDPYTGYSVPWLLDILLPCAHCLPNCLPFPPLP